MGMPSFAHKGILCGMAAFKQHCSFGFWKGKLIVAQTDRSDESSMGQFGRIATLDDLPRDKVLLGYIKMAVRLNEEGVQLPARPKSKVNKELVIPDYFTAALKKNKKAMAAFDQFSYSHKKEYVEWIAGAKAEEMRQRRIQTALEWLAKGKSRNWKYEKC